MKDRGNDQNLTDFLFGGGAAERAVQAPTPNAPRYETPSERIVRRDGDYALIEGANGEYFVRDFSAHTSQAAPSKPIGTAPQTAQNVSAASGISEFNLGIRRDHDKTSVEVSFSNDTAGLRDLLGGVFGAAAASQAVRQPDRAIGFTGQPESAGSASSQLPTTFEKASQQSSETQASLALETAQRVGALGLRGMARSVWRHKVSAAILAVACMSSYEAYGLASGGEHLNPLHPMQTITMMHDDFNQLINHPFGTIVEQAGRL